MPSPFWLSVLIPVYNVEAFLKERLASVILQADKRIEIIALDDCSTDTSAQVLQDFTDQSPVPIKIMKHINNQGSSAARNSMLNVAQGDYLWFLDSDDLMEPDAIAKLKQIVDTCSPNLVICDFRILREQQKLKHKWRGENHRASFVGKENSLCSDAATLFYGLYKKGELHIWSKISKRSLWANDLHFPVGRYMEDMVTTPRLALRASNFYYCPQVWITYRQRTGSILATPSVKKLMMQHKDAHVY